MARMHRTHAVAVGLIGTTALAIVLVSTIRADADAPVVDASALRSNAGQPRRQSICPTFSDSPDRTTTSDVCRRLLADAQRLHGMKSQQVAMALLHLAGHESEWGGFDETDALFRRAVEAHVASCGRNSARTALCLLVYADFLVAEACFEEAVGPLERAVEIHEQVSGSDHPETVLAMRSLAEVQERLGRDTDARAMLERERRSRETMPPRIAPTACDDPDHFRAHEHVGARLFAQGNVDAAEYHFRRAIELRPDLGENHNNLGTTLSTRAQASVRRGDRTAADKEMTAAIEQFAEACRAAPDVPAIHVNLANALAAAGRFREAADKFGELLDRDPNNPALINNYGVALYRQGKKEEAIVQFRRALEIRPDLKDAQESLRIALGEAPDPALQSDTKD